MFRKVVGVLAGCLRTIQSGTWEAFRTWLKFTGGETNRGSTPCTWNIWVKIGHLIQHRGNNKEWLETTIHLHPPTHTQTHTYTCWSIKTVLESALPRQLMATWTWFMCFQFSTRNGRESCKSQRQQVFYLWYPKKRKNHHFVVPNSQLYIYPSRCQLCITI